MNLILMDLFQFMSNLSWFLRQMRWTGLAENMALAVNIALADAKSDFERWWGG
ncbi:MAG: hypothetical protein V4805_11120 [Pseudomonadota bacterium]